MVELEAACTLYIRYEARGYFSSKSHVSSRLRALSFLTGFSDPVGEVYAGSLEQERKQGYTDGYTQFWESERLFFRWVVSQARSEGGLHIQSAVYCWMSSWLFMTLMSVSSFRLFYQPCFLESWQSREGGSVR